MKLLEAAGIERFWPTIERKTCSSVVLLPASTGNPRAQFLSDPCATSALMNNGHHDAQSSTISKGEGEKNGCAAFVMRARQRFQSTAASDIHAFEGSSRNRMRRPVNYRAARASSFCIPWNNPRSCLGASASCMKSATLRSGAESSCRSRSYIRPTKIQILGGRQTLESPCFADHPDFGVLFRWGFVA